VFAQWEPVIKEDAILATNTSSLSITAMGRDLQHPERLVGFHVFNPVEVTPLLEIVAGEKTDDSTLATAFDLAAKLRRIAVRVEDAPSFVVNRVLTRMFDEIGRAMDAGGDPQAVDHALDPMGLPMTPLQLLDFVGPAVLVHITHTMNDAYPDRFTLSPWLDAVADAGLKNTLPTRGDTSETYLSEGANEAL
ncbi:3-hydroxyacyl-CoA dehydrogenase family protein, partial [Corynebacterium xerosis]